MKRMIPTLALALLAPTAVLAAPASADVASPAQFTDASGDVGNAKLDIRTVSVKSRASSTTSSAAPAITVVAPARMAP